jgi:hypothetical protein
MAKCNCLSDVNAKIQEAYGDGKASVSEMLCIIDNTLDAFPALTAKYRPKKKDGSFGKEKTVSIRPAYCPFCGQKYFPEPTQGDHDGKD